jgi:hypothetical protein
MRWLVIAPFSDVRGAIGSGCRLVSRKLERRRVRQREIRDRLPDVRNRLDHLDLLAEEIAVGRAEQHARIELLARLAQLRRRRLDLARLGRQVVHHRVQRHPGAPVDERVVDLGVDRDLPVLQSVDHVELPQRPAAIEEIRMQAADQLLELRDRAGRREREAPDVVVEVDVVVVDEQRMVDVERHRHELFREQRSEVHALRDVRLVVFVEAARVAGRELDEREAGDVHRGLGRLHVQKARVDATQLFHSATPQRRPDRGFGRSAGCCSGRQAVSIPAEVILDRRGDLAYHRFDHRAFSRIPAVPLQEEAT